jgi:ParB family chromosome partitioning protein
LPPTSSPTDRRPTSGLIENLIVKSAGDGFYSVANGNRRLAALHMIDGPNSDLPVPITLHDVDETKAFEYSLTTAITAEQLHPVDQYEAFARLEEHGKTEEEIAQQYGMAKSRCARRWRSAGCPRRSGRPGARRDQGRGRQGLHARARPQDAGQDLRQAGEGGTIFESYVKKELGADADRWDDVVQLLDLSGADAYRAAGGVVTEDLFGKSHIISDEPAEADGAAAADRQMRRAVQDGGAGPRSMSDLPHGARFWPQSQLKRSKDLKYEGDEEERCARLRLPIEALNDIDDEGAGLTDEQDQQRDQLQHDLDAIESEVRGAQFRGQEEMKQTRLHRRRRGRSAGDSVRHQETG